MKTVHVRDTIKTNWITQGIKISSKKMWLLDNQRNMTVMKKDLEYIEHCRKNIQEGDKGSKDKGI
jgi:hypothetical protein